MHFRAESAKQGIVKMAFLIKDTKLKVPFVEILQEEERYVAFPTNESALFDQDTLLPVGLLSYSLFDNKANDEILIAVPNIQGTFDGDYPFITYSLTSEGWLLDDEYSDGLEYKIEEPYIKRYKQAQIFFKERKLKTGEGCPLFKLGGQPTLGQNWDSMLYDEMGDNPELDHYHDVMEDGSESDFEYMSTREITYFDEELEKEFIFLGKFSYDLYLGSGGDCIVFYQPELKKVMVVAEFS